MCGITGYSLPLGNTVFIPNLESSVSTLKHRGPDGYGIYVDTNNQVGLAHSRLAILELSPLGDQPMISNDKKFVLIFNGEIYNYKQIRNELLFKGYIFKGNSDTEVLLNLLQDTINNGEDISTILHKLNGIFAFALYNTEDGTLIIVRDAFGVKPLYYSSQNDLFAFSSEIKALLSIVPRMSQLDEISIHRYLTFLWCPGDGTPFKSVKKLGPGELVSVKHGKIIKHNKWYRVPFIDKNNIAKISETLGLSVKDLICKTRQSLKDAVHRQLISDVPVGAFLSGGLDSSSVVAFAREINPNIHCFTIQATDWSLDEVTDDVPYAVEVARHLNVPLEIVPINSAKMANDFADMVVHLDEPIADPACLNVLYISQLARESGIKVLLSGAGGDDIFTGYRRHKALDLEKYWTWLPKEAKKGIKSLTDLMSNQNVLSRRVKKMFRSANLDPTSRLIDYFTWASRDDLYNLYTPDLRSAVIQSTAESPIYEFLNELPSNLAPLQKMLAIEQRFFLGDHNLIYTDKMSMAAGVEVRVPFLDLDLVNFAAGIPLKYKQHGTSGKWILKKAMEPYLPKNIIYRKKSGFGAPLRRWIKFELKEMIDDILSYKSLQKRGLFEPVAVQRLIISNLTGKIDASYTILSLLLIELWCRRFIDNIK